jgi:hypothetical protein
MLWSREDHPERPKLVGKVALVVKPKVRGYWLSKTLMDGGSSLNIMYIDTFKRMRLKDNLIQPSATTFHGIVPGRKAHLM